MDEEEKLVCHNCGKDNRATDPPDRARKHPSARDRVMELCPECLVVSRMYAI